MGAVGRGWYPITTQTTASGPDEPGSRRCRNTHTNRRHRRRSSPCRLSSWWRSWRCRLSCSSSSWRWRRSRETRSWRWRRSSSSCSWIKERRLSCSCRELYRGSPPAAPCSPRCSGSGTQFMRDMQPSVFTDKVRSWPLRSQISD